MNYFTGNHVGAISFLIAATLSGGLQARAATYLVTTKADSGVGSLRQAIIDANSTPEVDTIAFQIAGTGVQTIVLGEAPLPQITSPLTIDGSTQPGYSVGPLIEINAAAATGTSALRVSAGNCTIRALTINRSTAAAIEITGPGGNLVTRNRIGTTSAGTDASPNAGPGVFLSYSGANMVISNTISGNEYGVYLLGASGSTVQGNHIGLNAAGTGAVPNIRGVAIFGSSSNLIGGSLAAQANYISGNTESGVMILNGSAGNVVKGNVIGLNRDRTAIINNGQDGVSVLGSSWNRIGGWAAGEGNIISGNSKAGVFISGATSKSNVISGNFIGTNPSGTSGMANGSGVTMSGGASWNFIGEEIEGGRNVISGNTGEGIYMTNCAMNRVYGNLIGLNGSGTSSLPNNIGVLIQNCRSNVVGSETALGRNIISGNAQDGLRIMSGATDNQVAGNWIGIAAPGNVRKANQSGVQIYASHNNVLRGNVVAGNNGWGVVVTDGSTSNVFEANFVGTDATGFSVVSNSYEGFTLTATSGNRLMRNVISGNGSGAMLLTAATGNRIEENLVGTGVDRSTPLPNGMRIGSGNSRWHSVELQSGSSSNVFRENLVAYTPAYNGIYYAGVRVRDGAVRNAMTANTFLANQGLSIDLGDYLAGTNDPCDADAGANDLQNSPTLIQSVTGKGTSIRGTLNSKANSAYRIDVYSSPACHPLGLAEGRVYLGSANVSIGDECSRAFVLTVPGNAQPGDLITAIATDAQNNSSEMSACSTSAVAMPELTMTRPSADSLSLSWPASVPGVVLKTTSSLVAPVIWTVVTDGIVTQSGTASVTLPMTDASRFFRLVFE